MASLRNTLSNELEKIPGLEMTVLQGKHAGFTFFSYKGKELAHFDNDNELDVRLTKSVIIQQRLTHPDDSKNHPNRVNSKPHWIVLQFKRVTRINEIVKLVKLAMKQV